MTAEITAEMLAREMCRIDTSLDFEEVVGFSKWFLTTTRAMAALQAQPTEAPDQCGHPFCGPTCGEQPTKAPGRVRMWMIDGHNIFTNDWETADGWKDAGEIVIEGHFIPDTEAHE